MFNKLKEKIENILQGGSSFIKSALTRNQPEYKANPQAQSRLNQSFLNYITQRPLVNQNTDAINQLKNDYSYKSPESLAFKNPFQQEMRQVPNPESPTIQRLNTAIAGTVDWAKRIGNTALDFTTRPVARLAANTILSAADLVTPGELPSFTAHDPAGKLLMGDVPVASFQTQTKNNSEWLQGMGMNKGLSNTLGFGGMAIGAALDAPIIPGGGAKKAIAKGATEAIASNLDDVAEVAWKAASRTEKLKTLITGKDQLIKSGWTAEAASKMSAKDTFLAIKNGITPKEWLQKAEENIRNTPLWNDFATQFKQWVGKRQASKFEGIASTEGFKRLDELGTQAFGLIESGEHKQVFQSLRDLLDGQWKKLNDAGIRTGYIESYLPRIWKETDGEAAIAMGRRLSKSSKFSLTRVIKDYNDGLAAGLHPKYEKLSDLIGAYVMSTEKSVADKQFFDWLTKTKTIMTPSEINKVPKELKGRFADWVTINADRFGFDKLNQAYKADPDMAGVIDNYLMDYGSNPSQKFGLVEKALKAGAGLNTVLKNWKLSAGAPGTGINSFGLMSVRRHMYAGTNPIKNLAEGWKWILKPSSANEIVQSSIKEIPDAVKHGLTLSVEDHEFFAPVAKEYKNILSKGYGVVASKLDDWFSKPLFQNVLPAMKIKTYRQNVEIFLKQGLDATSAKELSARVTNDLYGGLNLDMMMRDKGTQAFLKNLMLAVDLYESQYNVGKGLTKMFSKNSPEAKVYQIYARNMLMDLINRNVVNKVLSGKYMFENSEGNKLNLDTGTYQADGTHRYIKGYGNDVIKIPFDIVDGIYHKDFGVLSRTIRNRLSMTAGTAYGIGTNTNYSGNKLYYPDDTPVEKGLAIGNEALGLALPSQATAVGRFALGKQGLEQTAAQLAELPIYYREGPYSKEEVEQSKLMQQGGMTGQAINEVRNEQRDIKNAPKLTDEQKIKNIQEGLPVDTQRNWLGKPKKPAGESSKAGNDGLSYDGTSTLKNEPITSSNQTGFNLRDEFKTQTANEERNKLIKKIYGAGLESDAQLEQALKANNIDPKEAEYYMASTLGVESGQRGEYVMSVFRESKSKEEWIQQINDLADAGVLTTGVTSQMVDDGIISKDRKKEIDAIIKGKTLDSSSGTSSKKVKLNLPAIKAPKLHINQANPLTNSQSAVKAFDVPEIKGSNKLLTIQQMGNPQLNIPKVKFSGLSSR